MAAAPSTASTSKSDAEAPALDAAKSAGFSLSIDDLKKFILNKEESFMKAVGGVEGLVQALQSDSQHGLPASVVDKHRQAYGANRLPDKKLKSFLSHLFEALNDLVLIALIIASIVTIIFGAVVSKEAGDWIEGIAIMVAVVVVSGVGSVQNYQQEKQFDSLSKVKADRQVLVIRDGHEQSISVYDIVVGDLFVIKTGEILPTDGYFLEGNGIKCDESAMTGEPIEIPKTVERPFLVSGAQVTAGAGKMLVLTTGIHTSYGQIVKDLESAEPPPTPLQEKLEDMAKLIGYFGLAGGLLIFFILLFTYLGRFYPDYPEAFKSILSFFIIGITIIVVAVPEGLPLAVTLTLAYSMKQMIKDNVLVRELNACETMGSATCICSDKTGTLTENRMTVVKGWFFGKQYDSVPSLDEIGGPHVRDLLCRAIALNSDAAVRYTTRDNGGVKIEFVGNKTEGGLLHMLRKDYNIDFNFVRKTATKFVYRENFNSARKRMSTIYGPDSGAGSSAPLPTIAEGGLVEGPGSPTGSPTPGGAADSYKGNGSTYTIFTKGASEMVLSLCSNYLAPDGRVVPFTEEKKAELHAAIVAYASRGLRTLSIAYRTLPASAAPVPANNTTAAADQAWEDAIAAGHIETGLTMLIIAGIMDPVRAAVPQAVAQCKSAGIKVRMVTGDNLLTAKYIAEECGIYNGGLCIEGREWREMTDEQREGMVQRMDVLARAIPSDKLILVETLKKLGETVAVTGDGTNDAPALRAAHVGCAMGIAGTEVAKEAGKMIILDDNFASIVVAVVWGRSVLENIRKFLVFQLTINLVAGGLTFIMACIHSGEVEEFPLTAIQLLWINLLMDSFAALMLATEPPDPELMKMRPQGKDTKLISTTMAKYVTVHSIYQIAMLLWFTLTDAGCELFMVDPANKHSREHYTNIFNTFVWFQLFNLFNARRIHDQWDLLKNYHKSTTGIIMVAIIVILQIILVEVGSDAFQTTPISVAQWFINIALGATSIPVGWICRLIPIREAANDPNQGAGDAAATPKPTSAGVVNSSSSTPVESSVVAVKEAPDATASAEA